MATATTTQGVDRMTTTTTDNRKQPTTDDVLNGLASSLCRLAAQMPYLSNETYQTEYELLCRNYGWMLHHITGVGSWQALSECAITVRVAAEKAAA